MWHSMMCVLTWKPKVTPRNRLLFQLAVSKLPIEETEFGSSENLWATPQAMDGMRVNQVRTEEQLKEAKKKGGCSNLREQVMWRTPDAHCGRGGSSKERMEMKLDKGMPISLNDQVAHPNLMWPTPASRDWKGGSPGTIKEDKNGKPYREAKNSNTKWGLTLDAAVDYQQKKMFPTPAARDYKDTGENTDYEKLAKKSKLAGAVKSKMWPTPRASSAMAENIESLQKRGRDKGNLEEKVALKEKKMFLTPGANEDAAGRPGAKMQKMLGNSPEVRNTGKGTLNPEWVEWLMGYPPGWTDISDSK